MFKKFRYRFFNGTLFIMRMIMLLEIISFCYAYKNSLYSKKYLIDSNEIEASNRTVGRDERKSKGMFPTATSYPLFSLAKVLNFFSVGDEVECLASTGLSVTRSGLCLNPYECRQRSGKPAGDCAYGLGVCCVFVASCGDTVSNNLTYFLSPGFPEPWNGGADCNVTISKVHEGVTQLKIEFIHFNIGQPDRSTGECNIDSFSIITAGQEFSICGQNHGQHCKKARNYLDQTSLTVYFEIPGDSGRSVSDGAGGFAATLVIRAPSIPPSSRLWLIRLVQLPLAYAAPHTCTQYYTEPNGTIITMNYASNGRHLARQEYRACVSRRDGICGINYTPCGPFRIGRPAQGYGGGPTQGGPGTGFYGQDGQFNPNNGVMMDLVADASENDGPGSEDVAEDPEILADVMEGSGQEPVQRGFIGRSDQPVRWSPYAQHWNRVDDMSYKYWGYGNYGAGLFGHGRQRCTDRITIPCDSDHFISGGVYGPGVCDPHHCGSSFCYNGHHHSSRNARTKWKKNKKPLPPVKDVNVKSECYVETTAKPFAVYIHFGAPELKGNPEDNLGACLFYQQIPCEG